MGITTLFGRSSGIARFRWFIRNRFKSPAVSPTMQEIWRFCINDKEQTRMPDFSPYPFPWRRYRDPLLFRSVCRVANTVSRTDAQAQKEQEKKLEKKSSMFNLFVAAVPKGPRGRFSQCSKSLPSVQLLRVITLMVIGSQIQRPLSPRRGLHATSVLKCSDGRGQEMRPTPLKKFRHFCDGISFRQPPPSCRLIFLS